VRFHFSCLFKYFLSFQTHNFLELRPCGALVLLCAGVSAFFKQAGIFKFSDFEEHFQG